VIVIAAIVPPSTLSPEIWLAASVNVPADTSSVSDASTVTLPLKVLSLIVAPSI
jgi:hypothetical protein